MEQKGRTTERLKRLDLYGELRKKILPLCRLKYGDIWEDPMNGHKVGVLDATKLEDVKKIMGNEKARLVVNDPPYNVAVGNANTSALFKINIKITWIFRKNGCRMQFWCRIKMLIFIYG